MRRAKMFFLFGILAGAAACNGGEPAPEFVDAIPMPAPYRARTGPLHVVVEGVFDAWVPSDSGLPLSYSLDNAIGPTTASLEVATDAMVKPSVWVYLRWFPGPDARTLTSSRMVRAGVGILGSDQAPNEPALGYPLTITSGTASSAGVDISGTAVVNGRSVRVSIVGPVVAHCGGSGPLPPGAQYEDSAADPPSWEEPSFDGPCAPFK